MFDKLCHCTAMWPKDGATRKSIQSLDTGEKAAMMVPKFNLEFSFEEEDSVATEDSGGQPPPKQPRFASMQYSRRWWRTGSSGKFLSLRKHTINHWLSVLIGRVLYSLAVHCGLQA